MESTRERINQLVSDDAFLYAVLSSVRSRAAAVSGLSDLPPLQKASLRKICQRGDCYFQLELIRNNQSFHENLNLPDAADRLADLLESDFRQAVLFCSDTDHQFLVSAKGKVTYLKRPSSRAVPAAGKDQKTDAVSVPQAGHNRSKQYLLPEGQAVPWMVELGIMNRDGSVVKQYYHKFRQVNRYLEFIRDILPQLPEDRPIRVVDFGCGKAYLSFALYDWLANRLKRQVTIVGLDLKSDVIQNSNRLALRFGYAGLRFEQGDIAGWQADGPVDLVICLHACNTATDAALAQAVAWQARVILAVPCCHKELIQKMQCAAIAPMLDYGLVRERFGSMATDTLRALALDVLGYRSQLLEFIEMEHTPKNILIRAVQHRQAVDSADSEPDQAAIDRYCSFRDSLGVQPWLEQALGPDFQKLVVRPLSGAAPAGEANDNP